MTKPASTVISDSSPVTGATVASVPWIARLIDANTPAQVAAVIVGLAQSLPDCACACLLWEDDGAKACGGSVTAAELSWARSAVEDQRLRLAQQGQLAAWRVLPEEHWVLLLDRKSVV